MLLLPLLAITLCAPAARAVQDEKSVQRVCKAGDMEGHTYKMVDFSETPPREEAYAVEHFPNRYMYFSDKNSYQVISSREEFTDPAKLTKMLRALPQARRYTLDNTGALNLYLDDKILFSFRCTYVLEDVNKYLKGDIVFTGYTRRGRSLLSELYRRWY